MSRPIRSVLLATLGAATPWLLASSCRGEEAVTPAGAAVPGPAEPGIPAAAWRRPLGQPLEGPGVKKPELAASHLDDGYWQGAPVGGFGAGTFSRSYRGDFVRWHMEGGRHRYESVPVNQFSVFQQAEGEAQGRALVLYAGERPGPALSAWRWEHPVGAGEYRALYPRSWYVHRLPDLPVPVVLEQYSPVLPHNYRETSYPVALYDWHLHNPGPRPVTVSLLFTWANMVGWFDGSSGRLGEGGSRGNRNRSHSERLGRGGLMKGLVLDRARQGPVTEPGDGQFALAAEESAGLEVTHLAMFEPLGDGSAVWTPFSRDGRLPGQGREWTSEGEPVAGALAVRLTLAPGERRTVPMALAWDLPVVRFGEGRRWHRRYTEFFGTSGTNAWAIARTALEKRAEWKQALDRWQGRHAEDASRPEWYRGMLFNELYALADLGTLWARPVSGGGAAAGGPWSFTWLECFDYPYYETLDVRFYGAFPLAMLWPDIEKDVMRLFAATIGQSLREPREWGWKKVVRKQPESFARKSRGAAPHDLGEPAEDPVFRVNAFDWQDTNRWKDLNSKFVLQVWRAFVLDGSRDAGFLRESWPAVREALDYLRRFDGDGDGLPENEGFPDQTYDTWPVLGESAYCGGLYLAALRAAEEMARRLGEGEAAATYRAAFERGRGSYLEKLWTGEYLRYDARGPHRESVMADQLAGQWYANLLGLGDIVPREMRARALRRIFRSNVLAFQGGEIGAVNGVGPGGEMLDNDQAQEVWTGTTLGLASLMLSEGMAEEGWRTARGIHRGVYERFGYWFRTPEAWDASGRFRASMYMRPGAVWALELALRPPSGARAE